MVYSHHASACSGGVMEIHYEIHHIFLVYFIYHVLLVHGSHEIHNIVRTMNVSFGEGRQPTYIEIAIIWEKKH